MSNWNSGNCNNKIRDPLLSRNILILNCPCPWNMSWSAPSRLHVISNIHRIGLSRSSNISSKFFKIWIFCGFFSVCLLPVRSVNTCVWSPTTLFCSRSYCCSVSVFSCRRPENQPSDHSCITKCQLRGWPRIHHRALDAIPSIAYTPLQRPRTPFYAALQTKNLWRS